MKLHGVGQSGLVLLNVLGTLAVCKWKSLLWGKVQWRILQRELHRHCRRNSLVSYSFCFPRFFTLWKMTNLCFYFSTKRSPCSRYDGVPSDGSSLRALRPCLELLCTNMLSDTARTCPSTLTVVDTTTCRRRIMTALHLSHKDTLCPCIQINTQLKQTAEVLEQHKHTERV